MQTSYFKNRTLTGRLIDKPLPAETGLIIVIPACNEENLVATLTAIKACERPVQLCEVIVILNHSEIASKTVKENNRKTKHLVEDWIVRNQDRMITYHIIAQFGLPEKKAGVGMARKIGMDEAARRSLDVQRPEIPIICLDADCDVSSNYLVEIETFFSRLPQVEGASILFEHPFAHLAPMHAQSIVGYELHLHYNIQGQKWAKYPFAYQTVGSSMAVRAGVYITVGGMNTRQAGEDFYFLHKVIERQMFGEITRCTVYPSARRSDRVPFGTGKAVNDLLESDNAIQMTYHHQTFVDLREMLLVVPQICASSEVECIRAIRKCPEKIHEFLSINDVFERMKEIRANSASQRTREKRFFHWFNAFRLMKLLHYCRDHGYQDIPVTVAAKWLAGELQMPTREENDVALLLAFRQRQRKCV